MNFFEMLLVISILIMTLLFISCRLHLVTYGKEKSQVAGLYTIHIRKGRYLNVF